MKTFKEAKREFERAYVRDVLELTEGNVSLASKVANKDRKDFYHLMKRTNVNPDEFRRSDKRQDVYDERT